tara:strand:+ start:1184 stop:1432 length:249 start_codon:yes stop_codon:yes gene_type:complete
MSTKIKIIEVKKSMLAAYKGIGENNAEIAKRLGITPSEVQEGKVTFGLAKGKSLIKKDYRIEYVDDLELDNVLEEESETVEI